MTNCEWLLKENKLEEFIDDYTILLIDLLTRDISKDFYGDEPLDKFRNKYPISCMMLPLSVSQNTSSWLLKEKEDV